jgi:hypothetical protein
VPKLRGIGAATPHLYALSVHVMYVKKPSTGEGFNLCEVVGVALAGCV